MNSLFSKLSLFVFEMFSSSLMKPVSKFLETMFIPKFASNFSFDKLPVLTVIIYLTAFILKKVLKINYFLNLDFSFILFILG